ncbi:MAG TPA: cyclic 2,3-diphosphoglycerate synthase [Candidatus Acidoferrales bacterium]|nr:cyclic 2,3-diphosphoglycerate synthase [Candidatus Acidoferrales bacterium]
MGRKKVIIIGAAGRDFHDYNVLFRDNAEYEVVAFTAAQIPYIADRKYPKELAGKLYPKGIAIHDESALPALIKKFKVDVCVQAYSDLTDIAVMDKASIANANGADFWLVAPEKTMISSSKPVIAVCAVRTGSGKSQTVRYISKKLRDAGLKVAIIRHPMPYGDLKAQTVERFETLEDLDRYKATVEEREDYEPHIKNGFVVFAGVDYEKILGAAEKEADVVMWDGGNNDASFIKPDLLITVVDPLRAGNELTYYPGETVARMADILLINKVNSATKEEIGTVETNLAGINSKAMVVRADSVIGADNPRLIKGRRVLIIEDGPTITHGGMKFGAGTVAAKEFGASDVVNAKKYAQGEIRKTFEKYPGLENELPAMGYSAKQLRDLQNTINGADCDVVISATPTNLRRMLNVDKPIVQISYELAPKGKIFDSQIQKFIRKVRAWNKKSSR